MQDDYKIIRGGKAGTTFIYILKDPITNEIRYVGKADNPKVRLNEHIRKWEGATTASRTLNINRCTISDVCNGRKKPLGVLNGNT